MDNNNKTLQADPGPNMGLMKKGVGRPDGRAASGARGAAGVSTGRAQGKVPQRPQPTHWRAARSRLELQVAHQAGPPLRSGVVVVVVVVVRKRRARTRCRHAVSLAARRLRADSAAGLPRSLLSRHTEHLHAFQDVAPLRSWSALGGRVWYMVVRDALRDGQRWLPARCG
eukprot:scaffold650_cov407-Prasinococcus_capsulatus_cf.AAC.2